MKRHFFVLVLLALIAVPVAAQTGTVTVMLSNIYGVTQTGAPNPGATPACWEKYHGLLGEKVTTQYKIDTATGMMIAESTLLGASVVLHPLGLTNTYAFMSDGVPQELSSKGIIRVIFEINKQFQDPRSKLLATLDKSNNCVIDNSFR